MQADDVVMVESDMQADLPCHLVDADAVQLVHVVQLQGDYLTRLTVHGLQE